MPKSSPASHQDFHRCSCGSRTRYDTFLLIVNPRLVADERRLTDPLRNTQPDSHYTVAGTALAFGPVGCSSRTVLVEATSLSEMVTSAFGS